MNSDKTILHLCADIGSDSQPYREAGYNVICVGKNIGVENYHPPENVYGIIANPPCTMFSIARRCAKTPRDLEEGMRLVKECLRIVWECQYRTPLNQWKGILKFWVIENPATGMLKYFLGKPVFEYCHSDYGSDFTKKTALWGCFTPPKKPFMEFPMRKTISLCSGRNINDPTSLLRYKGMKPQERREQQMHDRSKCYELFAKAFFEVNR